MKFSAAIVFATVASVTAEKNLRVPQITSKEPTEADARVTIQGMKGDLSDEDVEIVNQSIIKAYNQAYSTSGYSMNSFKVGASALIEDTLGWDPYCRLCPPVEEDTMTASKAKTEGQLFLGRVEVSWDPFCRLCPPDVEATIKNLGDMHQTFENKFCAGLRESASDAFTEARDCSFSFLNMPGQAEENLPIEEQSNRNNGEVQLTLEGTLHDFSENDLKLINEATISAYNEAFSSAGYKLQSFKAVADFDLPSNVSWDPFCRFCPPDTEISSDRGNGKGKKKPTDPPAPTPSPPYVDPDCLLPYLRSCPYCEGCNCYTWDCGPFGGDSKFIIGKENNGNKLIVASAATLGWDPYCRLCPPDAEDAATVVATPKLSDEKLAFLHTAFEKTLCTKLKNSGETNFANVHNCSFRFVFAPVSEATTAQA